MAGIRISGSPILQRACNACAKAKRRCDKLCPCSRCQADGVLCSYRNLPWLSTSVRRATNVPVKLRAGETPSTVLKYSNESEHTALKARHRYFTTDSSLSSIMQPSTPPMVWRLEVADMKLLSHSLRELPAACIHDSGMTGIPPDVLINNPILLGKQAEAALSSTLSLIALLRITQSLVAKQATSILHDDNHIREHAQKQQRILMQLSHRLWLEAPTSLPNTMTAHTAWKLGESIRRTIIASHLLATVARASNTGTVQHQPFLASLPFDRRIALWSMADEDPWLAYIDVKQTPLVSLSEWLGGEENGHVQAASVQQRILLILYQPWSHRKLAFSQAS
jgi:hypothetical protein